MSKASRSKKSKSQDPGLMNNDILRPWTIDVTQEQKLLQVTRGLDQTLSLTSPQKYAGNLGSSVLDSCPPGFREFKLSWNRNISENLQENTSSVVMSAKSKRENIENDSQSYPTKLNLLENEINSNDNNTNEEKEYDDSDLKNIDKIKHSLYVNTMRSMRAKTAPIHAIRYSTRALAPLLPSGNRVLISKYHNKVPQFSECSPSSHRVCASKDSF